MVFSALAPSLLELFAQPIDAGPSNDPVAVQDAWRRDRLKGAADMVILVNPAFEATRYQPVHDLAQRAGHNLSEYDPPTLLIVTSTADAATRTAFPFGRFFNTLFQHPFASDSEANAAKRTPGFVDQYVTHTLSSSKVDAVCSGWRTGESVRPNGEDEKQRIERLLENAGREKRRHEEWNDFLRSNNQALPQAWTWQYCGGTTISKNRLPQSVNSPVWNVITDGSVIANHSDIMGEALHSFIRQLYLDLPQ